MAGILDAFRLDGKIAVVTGSERGLGRGMAVALAQAGADVLGVTYAAAAPETAAAIAAAGRRYVHVQADLSSLEPIQGGTIALNGEIIETGKPGTESAGRSKRGSELRTRVGMVFQSYTLFPWLTIEQNIRFGLRERGMPEAQQKERAAYFIAKVGLRGFEQHFPKQLSGGMQQRTAIARALANDPKILLMDEPFGALDNQTRVLMQELLLGIWEAERKTVLFVTHDIDEAIFMANRVAVFSARPGRIKTELAVDLPHPRHYTIKTSPEFMDLKARLTEEIRAESMAADLH